MHLLPLQISKQVPGIHEPRQFQQTRSYSHKVVSRHPSIQQQP